MSLLDRRGALPRASAPGLAGAPAARGSAPGSGSDPLIAACLVEGLELEGPIGQGGSATVWAARWRGREVAVRVLEEGRRPPGGPRLGLRLEHPGILAPLEQQGTVLGRAYLLFERFPTDLARLVAGRPLERRLIRPVLVQLLDAIDHAHRRGVVHGDLKPANVLVDPHARPVRVVLTDFGQNERVEAVLEASLLSSDRQGPGTYATLAYLAPERLAGAAPSVASDVFALGVLLFELLTGRLPQGLELPSELQPGLDPRCDVLVKRCLARDPARRPASADALRREVLRLFPPGGSRAGSVGAGSVGAGSAGAGSAGAGSAGAGSAGAGSAGGACRAGSSDERAGMVRVGESFLVVGDREDPAASPMHERRLAPFWIDRTPVTNRAYLGYVLATGAARPPRWPARGRLGAELLDQPVTGVSWDEALAYARWAGKRLPTEYEWERAAQGPEQRSFPYGEAFDPARVHRGLGPVGSAESSEGVCDLTGNGWEWTGSPFGAYPDPGAGTELRALRGGFQPGRGLANAHGRAGLRRDCRDPLVTFRCAQDDA